jgi:hypothetical protein
MPFCIHCGYQNPEVAKFCSSCGQAIALQSQAPDANKTVSPVVETTKLPEQQSHATTPVVKPESPVTTELATPPPVTSTNQAQSPVSSPGTSPAVTNPLFETPAFWGAVLVLIGFFLPWVSNRSYFVQSETLNGAGFAKTFMGLMASQDQDIVGIIFEVLLFLMPAASAYIIFDVIFKKRISKLSKIVRFIPFSVYVLCVILIIISVANGGDKPDITQFKIGLILSILGAGCMLFLKKD